jgi:hypothetical protein
MDFSTLGYYALLLVGLYLVGSSIYNIVMAGNRSGWIVNGISTAIGGAIAYFAWSKISAPAPLIPPMSGGKRKWY